MMEEAICDRCHQPAPKKVDQRPTWFGRYHNDKRVEVICSVCWAKGERWRYDKP